VTKETPRLYLMVGTWILGGEEHSSHPLLSEQKIHTITKNFLP